MGEFPVVIVGCHRSGTSLLANIISQMGWRFGGLDPLEADEFNQRGYFECGVLNVIMGKLVGAMPSYEEALVDAGVMSKWGEYLDRLVAERDGPHGIKETRIVYRLPQLLPALASRLGKPRLVFIERDYRDVVDSLNRMHPEIGNRRNKAYTDSARHSTHASYQDLKRSYDCHWVRFEMLTHKREDLRARTVDKLGRFLEAESVGSDVFDRGLVHHGG